MSARFIFTKGLLAVGASATVLTGFMAAPTVASAQDYPPPPPQYYQCQQSTTNGQIGGALLGGLAGAALGSNVARGGGRTGGAIIGGVAGAAVGSSIGGSAAANNCANQNGPGPGPAYYDAPPPPPPPPPPQCGPAETRIHYPDGSVQSFRSRACRDPYNGVWHIVQ